MSELTNYNAAIYVRLSKEDEDASDGRKNESNSITNQKQLILDYLQDKPEINIVSVRIDDGYTGTNYDRPAFQLMMNDIKAGTVNCVVVKDLSRFGREYINAGKYIDRLFPFYGVRLIAINDNIDTVTRDYADDFSITLKNLMNDNYCRDISMKIRSQFQVRRKNGEYLGAFAPYGYMKSEDDHTKLEIDPYAAGVIQDIFRWKIEGMSQAAIAKRLTEQRVLAPLEYKRSMGSRLKCSFQKHAKVEWTAVGVGRMPRCWHRFRKATAMLRIAIRRWFEMARTSKKNIVAPVKSPPTPKTEYSAALYARISVEDERKREADTIGNQIQLLRDFAGEDPDISVFDVYCDDDVSGTDFQRPEFSRMMNDIRDGKVNCVIVKDLSRLGRNHLESGEFIEMVFPYLNVRFISITDRFDSLYKQADISVQIKNLLNERYAKDVSKKICSVMESMQKQGKYVGSKAPYGYLRDPMDKHHLVIDPEAAPIVRELFEMVAEGCTLHYAAVTMNDRGIPSPGRHNFNLGLVKSDKFKNSLWYQQTVRKILIDRTYLGWTIGGKYRSDFYSSGEKKSKAVPKEDWIITKGTHEPIVSEGLFDCVQKYFDDLKHTAGAATKYNCKSKQASIFKGHLRCGECGKAMFLRAKKNNGKTTWWYYCTLHENYNSSYCPKKAVKKEELESSVLRLIKVQMQLFTDAQAIVASLNQREKNKSRYRIFQEQIRSVMARIDLYGERKATLYRSFKEGILSEQEYIAEANACATKADELRIFAHELEKEAQKYSPEYKGSIYWTELIKEYGNRTELDAAMVDALIDEVVLFNDGHYEVKLKYRDEMEELLLNAALWQKEAQRYA